MVSIFAELYLFVCTTSSLFFYLGVHYCYDTFYRQLKCCCNCFGKHDKHFAQAIRAAFISFICGPVALAVDFGPIEGYDSLLLALYVEACIICSRINWCICSISAM